MPFIRVTSLSAKPVVIYDPKGVTLYTQTIGPQGILEDVLTQDTFNALQPYLQRLRITGQILWEVRYYGADVIVETTTTTGGGGGGGGGGGLPVGGGDGQFLGIVGGVPAWVTPTEDMILPAFAVTLALSGVANPLEAGASIVNPQLASTHNEAPDTASLTGPDNVQHSISPATATALGYGGAANTFPAQTFVDPGTTLNQVFAWTYLATVGAISRSVQASVTFERRTYFDMVAIPGAYNAAFITALASSRLQPGYANNYAFAAGNGSQYAHIVLPTGWGDPTTFKEHVSQLPVSFTKVATGINVTNANGVVISCEVWRAPQANTSAFSYDVS